MENIVEKAMRSEILNFLYGCDHESYYIVTFSNDKNDEKESFEDLQVTDTTVMSILKSFIEKLIRQGHGFEKYRQWNNQNILVRWVDITHLEEIQRIIKYKPDFEPNAVEVALPLKELSLI